MALDVKVKIDLSKPAGRTGSWHPFIFAPKGEGADVPYKECFGLDEVKSAGFEATSDAYKAARTLFMQDNPPEKVAVATYEDSPETAILDFLNKGNWRQLLVPGVDIDELGELAAAIETTDRMLFAQASDKAKISSASLTGYDRTVVVYYPDKTVYAAAAVVGATAGMDAGGYTYKNIILKGVAPLDLSDSEIEAIHALGALTVVTKAGDIVTTEGKTAGGEYADVVDGMDYTIQNIAYRSQKVLNNAPKVPYDNNGIAMLESATLGALKDSYNNGIIAAGDDGKPLYSVNFALRSQTTAEDRAERKYPYGSFSFELAGAIHTADVTGEVTV